MNVAAKVTYCPKCKHAIPAGESRCVACGGPRVGAISISRGSTVDRSKPLAKGAPHEDSRLTAIIVGVLMFVLMGILIYRFGPMIEFPGKGGAVSVEPGVVDTAGDAGQEGDGFLEGADNPHDKGMITITNLDYPRSGKHSTIGYKTPISDLKLGMTPSQVKERWGQPLSEERIHLDQKSLESWAMEQEGKNNSLQRGGVILRYVYGDPLYGIYITGRYADFRNGRLDYFYMEPQMDKLYKDAIEKRKQSSLY